MLSKLSGLLERKPLFSVPLSEATQTKFYEARFVDNI